MTYEITVADLYDAHGRGMCSLIQWETDNFPRPPSVRVLKVPDSAQVHVTVGVVVCTLGVLRDWSFWNLHNLAIAFVFSLDTSFNPKYVFLQVCYL